MSPHISIKGETIFALFGFPFTNSLITSLLMVILFIFIAKYYYVQIKKKDRSLSFYALHSIFIAIYEMINSVLREKTKTFFGLLGAFFFFILLCNWSGLIPGVGSVLIKPSVQHEVQISEETVKKIPLFRGGTADLNTTVALALISVILTQIFGFKYLGPKEHLKKYFDFRDPIMIMLGPLEIIQEFARIISFGFRLYGNIFAGEVLLTIIPFLLPVFFSFVVAPLFMMEIFVGLVQAFVFVMLSAVFINMATTEHH
ncbi:MAG: F0F1 ATP synthase subunit A [Candidatus Roizmanbacteria bacterium]|nr:F0F1 ATP synthase subunit A [Candidatus Roizmanbacteria bacterium]